MPAPEATPTRARFFGQELHGQLHWQSASPQRPAQVILPSHCHRTTTGLADPTACRMAISGAVLPMQANRSAASTPYRSGCPIGNHQPTTQQQCCSFLDADESEFLCVAEAGGAASMTVFEPFGVHWPEDVFAESLAPISSRAAGRGIRVNVEFMPFLGIPVSLPPGAWCSCLALTRVRARHVALLPRYNG